MKPARCHPLAAILAAVYLAVVTFGHHFHNHGVDGQERCACVVHSHVGPCHEHDASRSDAAATGGLRSSTSKVVSTGHCCPICQFFSHHYSLVDAAEVATIGRVEPQAVAVSRPGVVRTCPGPQQPRAPPRLA